MEGSEFARLREYPYDVKVIKVPTRAFPGRWRDGSPHVPS